jgi:hypothetical protein
VTATARLADVSSVRKVSDWQAFDLDGLIIKVSEGIGSRDSRFAAHLDAALARHLPPMGYHFGWPSESASAQVSNYVGGVGTQPVHAHWLDLEAYSDGRNIGSMTAAEIRAWATQWIAGVRAEKPGDHLGVYASLETFRLGWVPTNADAYWVAEYPVVGLTWAQAEARARPPLPAPYPPPLLWQFASQSPSLDRDLAYLSPADLAAWAAGGKEPDVELKDKVALQSWVLKQWPKDSGIQDGSIEVNTALGSGYAYSRKATDMIAGLTEIAVAARADVTALAAEVDALKGQLATALPDPAAYAQQVATALAALLAKGAGGS